MISECVPVAFSAALPTFSEFKHSLSGETIKKTPTPFPQISKQTAKYLVENMLQTLATEKL